MIYLPTHPYTGLTAIGFRRNGDPIWPIKGGSEDAGQSDDTSQDDLGGDEKPEIDWKAKSREWERKAKANKIEAEKAAERLAKAEQAAKEAEARALRREVALEHKLSKDDAALLDAITDEDTMRALAARLAAGAEKKSNYVPREGANTKTAASDDAAFVRALLGG